MSEPVLITLMICLTVIFVSLILAIVIRWICVVAMSRPQNIELPMDDFVSVAEFENYEHIVSETLHKLEERIDKFDRK